jgi:hypothetical protein
MQRLPALSTFKRKFGLALALVVLGDQLFYEHALSGGYVGLFALAMMLCLTLGRPGVWRRWDSATAAFFALAYGCALIVDPGLLSWTMFWAAISMAALLSVAARYDDGWLWFQRLLFHAVRSPIAPFIDLMKIKRAAGRPRQRRFDVKGVVTVLALPLAGSAIILSLFATANPIIADVLAMIGLPDLSGLTLWRITFWTALFALGWSILRPRVARHLVPTFDGSGDLHLPGVSVASVTLSLILFNALFAIENLLDIAYLSRVLPLPEGMTITEYVHRGAYPLIVTALLAGLFVLVTLRPGSVTAGVPAIRRLVVLWIIQNLVLVASSVQRTLEYIDVSMLTTLRIHALAWMGLVAVGLILICWRMLREKSAAWLINTNLAVATAVLTIFCVLDSGAIAAWWNVRHAGEVTHNGRNLDLCYLSQLGPSSLLALIDLEAQPITPSFRERVQAVRTRIQQQMIAADTGGQWTWRNSRRLAEAELQLNAMSQMPLPPGLRNCDGSIQRQPLDVTRELASPAEPRSPANRSPALTEAGQR